MKVSHLLSGIFAAAALMLTGCLAEPDFEPVPEGGIPINVDGSINQVATKVNAHGFEDKDALGLYAVNYENSNNTPGTLLDEGNQADHVKYILDESAGKWNPVKPVYFKDVNTNVDIYAFYPHTEPSSVSAYNFEVQKDQSMPERDGRLSGYEASDFLWGKVENVAPTQSKIKLKLNHMMSGAQVILAKGTGFDEAGDWDLLEKKVLVTNTTRKASIDLSTGKVTPIGGAQATGIVMSSQNDGSFRAVVVPQTVEALSPLFNITVGGVTYGFKKSADYSYEAGRLHIFTITINRKYPSGEYEFVLTDTQITDWKEDINTHEEEARQYYCVKCEEPGTLGRIIRADGKNPDKIRNLKVSGKIHMGDFYFMRDSMALLQSVNLKEVKVMPCYRYEAYVDNTWGHYLFFDYMPDDPWGELKKVYPEFTSWSDRGYVEGDAIPNNAFNSKSTLVNFVFPETINKIGSGAFSNCSLLSGALIIPDGVREIGSSAFENCKTISSLSLPVGLDKIDDWAFAGCSSLSCQLNLPSTLTYIGYHTFYYCTGLSGSLVLPENLSYLGDLAFYMCSDFTGDLKIPESLKQIGNSAFSDCYGLNGRLTLHDDLKLAESSFSSCNFQGELVLPSNLMEIPAGCFRYNDFSSIAGFPDELLGIGSEAFADCYRLMGEIDLPESLVSLGSYAFSCCRMLQGVTLPSKLAVIGSGAFYSCYGLNKIVSRSTTPPVIQSGAFDGVAKDNFTVEVPANAVKKYQADSKWGEFKRIAAHYDFSISRNLSRTLNAGKSQTYVLRAPANYKWSVQSKPSWVDVAPSSGTGKAEITVTFAEMTDSQVETFVSERRDEWNNVYPDTYAGRAGEIVFSLDDVSGYTTSMTVEQYDYEYGDGDVLQLNQAKNGNGVNIVFMGDCYDARDIAKGSYLADLQEAVGHYFAVEPYATYKDWFNVYAVFGESSDSGMGTVNTIRDARFGSQYALNGICPDFNTCYEYASKAIQDMNPSRTLVVLVENTTEYGGICYMWGDGSAIACCPKSADAYPYDFRGIVQHEAGGHGFGKLADEYIYHNAFIETCGCPCCSHLDELLAGKSLGWYRNLEATADMNQVGWAHLIFNPDYSDVVDIYEGGYFHSRGVFRSEPTSCMNNNIPYFSAISRQAIVERIMEYAGEEFTLEKFYAKDSDAFGATTKAVAPGLPVEGVFSGRQHAPVFMGDRPEFAK